MIQGDLPMFVFSVPMATLSDSQASAQMISVDHDKAEAFKNNPSAPKTLSNLLDAQPGLLDRVKREAQTCQLNGPGLSFVNTTQPDQIKDKEKQRKKFAEKSCCTMPRSTNMRGREMREQRRSRTTKFRSKSQGRLETLRDQASCSFACHSGDSNGRLLRFQLPASQSPTLHLERAVLYMIEMTAAAEVSDQELCRCHGNQDVPATESHICLGATGYM